MASSMFITNPSGLAEVCQAIQTLKDMMVCIQQELSSLDVGSRAHTKWLNKKSEVGKALSWYTKLNREGEDGWDFNAGLPEWWRSSSKNILPVPAFSTIEEGTDFIVAGRKEITGLREQLLGCSRRSILAGEIRTSIAVLEPKLQACSLWLKVASRHQMAATSEAQRATVQPDQLSKPYNSLLLMLYGIIRDNLPLGQLNEDEIAVVKAAEELLVSKGADLDGPITVRLEDQATNAGV